MEKHPLHLKNPELQTSPEVQRAVEREEQKTGKKVPNDPAERIEAYIDRLENIFLSPDERKRDRNLEMFRDKIYDTLIIKRENFPDSYFELQQRIARERGQAVEEISDNVREQMMTVAIEDQKASLDAWMDYLTSDDAVYPAWFKYFVWKNVTKLSQFDKERSEFKKRTDSTVAPYPDIYSEPLAQIADLYEQVKADNKNLQEPEIKEAFSKKFPTLYAELIQKSLATSMENREEIDGKWLKYEQGKDGDAEKLFQSLEGKGTGWCTAGHSTAQTQIESGDFYVYYTNDSSGEPTQPRLAIRMDGNNRISEVRGILPHQGVETVMQEILDSKLAEFGAEADVYHKKSEAMKRLTTLEKKQSKQEPFTKDELIFLYEIETPINGFGYQKDPRIAELRGQRNTQEDLPVIFDCRSDQIITSITEVSENTLVYLGPWNVEVFNQIKNYPNIKHFYESFPDKKIWLTTLDTDPTMKTPAEALAKLTEKSIYLSDYAKDLLSQTKFSSQSEHYELVKFTVAQLGFSKGATTAEIYIKAKELGLELCPAEVGPQLRLAYPGRDWFLIAMEPMLGRRGDPGVFRLSASVLALDLDARRVWPSNRWNAGDGFVFRRSRKS